jgi:hypothetical protein
MAELVAAGAPASAPASESVVLVPVPEAERVVSPHRAQLDRSAALGVPAHVTVLYPFVPPPAITPPMLDALAGAVTSVGVFGCEFDDFVPKGTYLAGIVSMSGKMSESLDRIELRA